ncbi:MAG TPA: aspartate aminotransferase family protein, partial [Ferruginibacter sp.]|nr:aspartate aminotransferase family protein [Ferruginibacter sp.]
LRESVVPAVHEKASLFRSLLSHPLIREVHSAGLMMAVHFDSFDTNKKIIDKLIERGVFTDWFLFAPHALRIAPPLQIPDDMIRRSCETILSVLNEL